jgi:hypothetical protein
MIPLLLVVDCVKVGTTIKKCVFFSYPDLFSLLYWPSGQKHHAMHEKNYN